MIKMYLKVSILVLALSVELLAQNSRLGLELSRTMKINKVIKRINLISEYINLHIMQRGFIPNNMNTLQAMYPGMISNRGYGGLIDFNISKSIITFTGVANNLSTMTTQSYKNSSELHPMADVLDNLDMNIPLSATSLKFLGTIDTIESLDDNNINTGNIFVGDREFEIAGVLQWCGPTNSTPGAVWYRPDFKGSFIVSFCQVAGGLQWIPISNTLDIAIFRPNRNALERINPIIGTRGYAGNNATPPVWNEYIYSGDGSANEWKEVR